MTENVFGIHTGSADYPRSHIDRLLALSSVVKFCHQFNDSGTVNQWRFKAPNAYFLGRDIVRDIEGGWLHNEYYNLNTQDEAYKFGMRWAYDLAKDVIAHGLQWCYWEAGPNEHRFKEPRTESFDSTICASFSLGFVQGFLAKGCKPAVGSWAYGQPMTPHWNTEDNWLQWRPVFQAIDGANRDRNTGVALAKPNAIYQLHQYAKDKTLTTSLAHELRHRLVWERNILPYNYWVPLIISETGYACDGPNDGKPSTEDMLDQIVAYNADLATDPYVIGYAWYDWRSATSGSPDDYMYCVEDMIRKLEQQNYTPRVIVPPGGIIPVPPPDPDPEPDEGTFAVKVTSLYGVNQRAQPTKDSAKLGFVGQGAHLLVEYPPINEYVKATGQDFWIWSNNITKE